MGLHRAAQNPGWTGPAGLFWGQGAMGVFATPLWVGPDGWCQEAQEPGPSVSGARMTLKGAEAETGQAHRSSSGHALRVEVDHCSILPQHPASSLCPLAALDGGKPLSLQRLHTSLLGGLPAPASAGFLMLWAPARGNLGEGFTFHCQDQLQGPDCYLAPTLPFASCLA